MKIVTLMLMRMISVRFLAILLGISLFVLSLETVSYSTEILALRPGHLSIVPEYLLYRAPGALITYLPISMLLAVLLTLTELSYRNEITALWAAGLSPVRIVVLLVPLAFLTGGLNFLLSDAALPAVVPVLRQWGIADYGKEKLKVDQWDPIWMRSGSDILRAGSANADSTTLKDVIIFRRDPSGLLTEQIYAAGAQLAEGRWTLKDVIVYYRGTQTPSSLGTLVYSGDIRPASAGARSGDPQEMSLTDLGYFIENSGFGIRPVWVYQTGWHKRIAAFFSTLLMIGLCVPLIARFRRGGGLGVLFAAGVGLGFVFFVFDGITSTMGELGFVTPWLAAWLPIMIFGAVAAVMTLRAETI